MGDWLFLLAVRLAWGLTRVAKLFQTSLVPPNPRHELLLGLGRNPLGYALIAGFNLIETGISLEAMLSRQPPPYRNRSPLYLRHRQLL